MRVRTTVTIEEGLLKQAKRAALERGISLSDLIGQSLRRGLLPLRREPIELPRSGQGGLLPGVDLADKAAVEEVIESGRESVA